MLMMSVLLLQVPGEQSDWTLAISLAAVLGVLAKVVADLVKDRRKEEENGGGLNGVVKEKLSSIERIQEFNQAKIDEVHRKLIPVLDKPEASGFGTMGMEEVIQANTDAIRENARALTTLTKFARWMYQEMTGKEPPPV